MGLCGDERKKKILKLGSLFDGSGGFPLAGALCGIEPIWASEVEPYPIAVTTSRFPNMKHLGDISKINGAEIEPVDVITFGSPCQDLSVAGKRAGLKHENNGDDETTRSGLFIEAVRIIKEMREKTNGKYPRYAVWENVPGAFSSNKGEDFRIVLEELVKVVEPTAVMPEVPRFGWAYADSYSGDGWSLAYRVLDAQYWGVPQRRRRIYLVADFGGRSAYDILFKSEGL
jgi:DNA (cytosine-5)-methyltransferase 1